MTYSVEIIDTVTGEKRLVDGFMGDIEDNDPMWTTGNYACDCNRALFFWGGFEKVPHQLVCGHWQYKVPFGFAEGILEIPLEEYSASKAN